MVKLAAAQQVNRFGAIELTPGAGGGESNH
jgi:hypothetical protein